MVGMPLSHENLANVYQTTTSISAIHNQRNLTIDQRKPGREMRPYRTLDFSYQSVVYGFVDRN
ncbi:hypothetical protein KIN20_000758 [Parelaphostrongylus tenuis]|uniref:Uncharacterized protein n=1 Tax=Parelaphostrongylus tenuis TaxID=148309 RepID=A0AAD5LV80_PARTN|nr:hypothetical protein KIN20_000758 [Parelaphostrongylus tenuis]